MVRNATDPVHGAVGDVSSVSRHLYALLAVALIALFLLKANTPFRELPVFSGFLSQGAITERGIEQALWGWPLVWAAAPADEKTLPVAVVAVASEEADWLSYTNLAVDIAVFGVCLLVGYWQSLAVCRPRRRGLPTSLLFVVIAAILFTATRQNVVSPTEVWHQATFLGGLLCGLGWVSAGVDVLTWTIGLFNRKLSHPEKTPEDGLALLVRLNNARPRRPTPEFNAWEWM